MPLFQKPKKELAKEVKSVHKQEDGVYYAVCATGSSSQDSLLSWIRLLQKENPNLGKIPVLFKLKSPSGGEQEELLQVSQEYEQISSEKKDEELKLLNQRQKIDIKHEHPLQKDK